MAYIYPFPSQLPLASSNLPLTLISLEDWALINIAGVDSRKYLQGQLTCDMNALTDKQLTQAAHCDAKGKLWSNILLFGQNDQLSYLERTSVCQQQLEQLQKYAVFSKLIIHRSDNQILLGLAGHNARQTLKLIYSELPDSQQSVVDYEYATLLYLSQPTERFIIIATQNEAERLFNALLNKVALNNSQQWLALDIEAGLPIIDIENSAQFLPQSINLQALNAISFTKGCYAGQEMVARAKYRGANKRAMYWLSGKSEHLPIPGEELELKLGDNWRRTGTVLAAVKLADNRLWVQAVLNNDLAPEAILRIKDDKDSELTIQTLPYSLSDEP